MDDSGSKKRKAAALGAFSVILGAVMSGLNDMDDKKVESNEKVESDKLPYMMNNPLYKRHREPPEHPLVERIRIEDHFYDPNRNSIKVFTSLYGWEFFALADELKPFIETSRTDPTKPMGNRMKKDYRSRLYSFIKSCISCLLQITQLDST
mmetsp:Transcript_22569/g.37683  ORF Transcript_22569/g.37683 Transcript_22569/m.37683 type:complete len:151 (+) Transcript_22569:122-574(+)|eukprot:CAMPEP_0174961118 /NCGR_PEP_ID=MMETSP0004_2-20121128/4067_1 /TAXON_ID=420556 /ORGANISM="Ochromonas sp., Strain CCMP1393" /LENGTH=150 /DNA_ID=CAMNT_0016209537 /DNA_START=111 /DNA_END=563 /DNA_ORIENTATION=-